MSTEPRARLDGRAPWDLDAVTAEQLRAAYLDLSGFVGWLRECDVEVPSCWHVHGWLVRRLSVLRHWREEVPDPAASAKSANAWWAALFELQRDWEEVRGHHGAHPPWDEPWGNPVATPALEDTLAEAVRRRRRASHGGSPW